MPVSNGGSSHTKDMKRSSKTEGLSDVLIRLQESDVKSGLRPTDYGKDNYSDLEKRNPAAAKKARSK